MLLLLLRSRRRLSSRQLQRVLRPRCRGGRHDWGVQPEVGWKAAAFSQQAAVQPACGCPVRPLRNIGLRLAPSPQIPPQMRTACACIRFDLVVLVIVVVVDDYCCDDGNLQDRADRLHHRDTCRTNGKLGLRIEAFTRWKLAVPSMLARSASTLSPATMTSQRLLDYTTRLYPVVGDS